MAELDERLDGLMEVVRLSYLIKREGGWGASCEWGETLSLGPPCADKIVCSMRVTCVHGVRPSRDCSDEMLRRCKDGWYAAGLISHESGHELTWC